uniref:Uncharacterized protein n=1 Tax=Leersia perrieri TaxID=77586 RepID=A0A0D9V4L1_9ORYZ
MKCILLAFNLGLVFVLSIPLLLEARPLATGDQDDENLPVLISTVVTAEETAQVMVDYLELKRSSSDSEDETATRLPAPDTALDRAARSPPSPHGRYPPQHRQIVRGRRPYAPPAPRGRNPPHWIRSGDDHPQDQSQGPWLLDVFHRLLRVLSELIGQINM